MWNWVRCTVLYTIELQTRVTLTHPRPASFPVLVFAQGTKAGFVVYYPCSWHFACCSLAWESPASKRVSRSTATAYSIRCRQTYIQEFQIISPKRFFHPGKSPQSGKSRKPRRDSLFTFDPNTATLEQLIRLGFSPKQARVILNYRDAGAVFRHKEDFARCYTVSTEKFAELAPYIRIDQTYSAVEQNPHTVRAGNRQENKPETDTAPDTNRSSPRPDTAPVPIPAGSNPDASPTPLRDKRDEQSRHAGPIELNSAVPAALVSIRGIGPLTAGRIIRYRNALGGSPRSASYRRLRV